MATVRIFPPPQFNGLATFQQETVLKSTEKFFLPIIASLLRLEKRATVFGTIADRAERGKSILHAAADF
jgi:hypothetical protein